MESTIPPAPPPPPLNTSTLLGSGRRTSANSDRILGIRSTESPNRPSPLASIQPETLQHAAANLRKTQYREPLLSSEWEQFLDRPDQLASGRYWEDFKKHAPVAVDKTGTTIHAPSVDTLQSSTNGFQSEYSNSLTSNSPLPQIVKNNFSNINSSLSSANTKEIPIQIQRTPLQNNIAQTATRQSPSPQVVSSPLVNNTQSNQQPLYSSFPQSSEAIRNVPIKVVNGGSQLLNHPQQKNIYRAEPATIANPQFHIHKYATQTPAAVHEANGVDKSTTYYPSGESVHTKAPAANYAKELRDLTLTERQKYMNQFQKPLQQERIPPTSIQSLMHERQTKSYFGEPFNSSQEKSTDVDDLIKDMEWKLKTGYIDNSLAKNDFCTKCRQPIVGDTPGVTALGTAYHVACFCCDECNKQLAGCSFYSIDGKNLCQVDYMNSLEKCDKCRTPITQKILRALGRAFHPECFSCPVCDKSLDGIPFTVDKSNVPHCLDCYHERFSPRCAVCLKAIAPVGTATEVARVIAMDKSYHVDCYRCEDCGMKLNSKIEGQGCYPLEAHLFCKNCNMKRLKPK